MNKFELMAEEDIEGEVRDSEEMQEKIQFVIIALESKLKAFVHNEIPSLQPQSVTAVLQNSPHETVNSPKLHLLKYNGDPTKWQEWWDSFEIIHENPNLSKANKFRHLKTLLEWQAAAAVSGIKTTDLNYDIALDV